MKKYWYILLWAVLMLAVAMMWPGVKEYANASRPCEGIGGEYFLWMFPSMIVYAASMLLSNKETDDA